MFSHRSSLFKIYINRCVHEKQSSTCLWSAEEHIYMHFIDSFWSPTWEAADLLSLVCDDRVGLVLPHVYFLQYYWASS